MFASIRVRFTMIYFLLVFIGMVLAGVVIIYSFEGYNHNLVSRRLDDISQIMMTELSKIEGDYLFDGSDTVQEIIDRHAAIGLREEIYVVALPSQNIVATSTSHLNRQVSDVLTTSLIIEGLIGKTSEKNYNISSEVRTKDKVYPIHHRGNQVGILYLRYDLSDIYATISRARMIIIQSVAIALLATLFIGALLSKRITDPINDVTKKAILLAEGDFNQFVEVRSEDEVGALAQTFNFLSMELKKYVSEISSEKSKLEAIINYMEDGLIAINAEGEIIHSNPKALNLLTTGGAFDESLIGDLMSIYNSGRITGGNGSKSITYNGKVIKVNFAPFLDESSNKVGVVFVFQDITEEERLENMRREFVANVSHELKTPLTSIKSYTETLIDNGVDNQEIQQSFLNVINTEADRMTRLVRDLLELSNFDANEIRLSYEPHVITRLVDNCILKVQLTADSKKQQIIKVYDETLKIAQIDYDKMEQLVLNILSNAIKYSDEKGEVHVEIREGYDDLHYEIVISDSGMGIPEEDIERIFERFYRVDKARTRAMGGTGLGLSIAKEIVEAHQGEIRIESELEVGTKVTIVLPYAPQKV